MVAKRRIYQPGVALHIKSLVAPNKCAGFGLNVQRDFKAINHRLFEVAAPNLHR